jgi:phosphoribosylformylglycinamidine synthase
MYDRPMERSPLLDKLAADDPARLPGPASSKELVEDLLAMLVDPSWVFRQFDHQLFRNTVVAPGADAAVLRLSAPGVRAPVGAPARAIALSTDGNSRWCALDPRAGTRLVVAESALNVACTGARPVALVNCLNFGNPEHPEVMWQLSEAIDGMAEACEALGIPVVGGNVSLYNESMGTDIDPTPVVGALGLIDKLEAGIPTPSLREGSRVVLLGPRGPGATSLAGSRWAAERRGHAGGTLPPLDLGLHSRLVVLVAALVQDRLVDGIHDVSDGGLAVALAEMAVKSGTGCRVSGISGHQELFGEGPSRVLLSVAPAQLPLVIERARGAAIPVTEIGSAGGHRIVIDGLADFSVDEAVAAWRGALPTLFAGP